MLRRLAAAFAIVLVSALSAAPQTTVKQSGSVTPGHAVRWITNGVIADAGTATQGFLSSIGVTNNGGPGICLNTAPITQAYNQLCLQATTSGDAQISYNAFGGATAGGLTFQLNGVTTGFPQVILPVTTGSLACFADTAGSIEQCSAGSIVIPLTENNIFVGDASNIAAATQTLPSAVQTNITAVGTIASGVWNGTVVGLTFGGTGKALTAANGGVVYTDADSMEILAATATAGQMLRSGSNAAPSWSTATFPSTATGSGTILRADGTNWVASTAAFPNTATGTGTILRADGTNWVASTATYPNVATSTGTFLRADGTNWATSTATIPDTFAQGDVLYASATNVLAGLAKDTNATRYLSNTGTSNAPAWAQVALATGVSGTLPVANGGTNCSVASGTCLDNITGFSSTGIVSRTGAGTYTFSTLTALVDAMACSTQGSVIYRNATVWVCLTPGTNGQFLTSGGAGANVSWTSGSGTGDVVGPASATDNAAARYDSTTGKLIQNSALIIADTTGALSRTGAGGIPVEGTNTNDSAAAGYVGEVIECNVAAGSAVSLTTNVPANICSVSLTAGDWDLSALVQFAPAATTQITAIIGAFSDTSATLPTTQFRSQFNVTFTVNTTQGLPVARQRVQLSSTTTYYLVVRSSFTVDTNTAYGGMYARRAR